MFDMFSTHFLSFLIFSKDERSTRLLPTVGDYDKALTRRQREKGLKLYEGIAHGAKKVVTKEVPRNKESVAI